MSHIIVARCHPLQYFGIRILVLMLALSLLWGAFEMGYMQSEEDIIEAKGGRNSLLVQQKILKKKNQELSKELLHLERKYILEQEATQLIKAAMTRDQQKIAKLESELQFYRGIVSPGQKEDSLYLQSLEISPIITSSTDSRTEQKQKQDTQKTNQYQYKFVIAQKVKKRTYTKGSVTIFLNGKQGKKSVKLPLVSLLEDDQETKKDKAFKFSFKYFQTFNGIINLPEHFEPESVDITIDAKTQKSNIELNDLAWSQSEGMKYVGK